MKVLAGIMIFSSAILADLSAQTLKQLRFIPRADATKKVELYPQDQFVAIGEAGGRNVTLYDIQGRPLSEQVFSRFGTTPYGTLSLAAINTDGRDLYGFIDRQGKPGMPFIYDEVGPYQYGMAVCKSKGACFLLDEGGNITPLPGPYTQFTPFAPGLVLCEYKGVKGLLDPKGNILLPCVYSEINSTAIPGLFQVKRPEKRGRVALANLQNEMLIPFAIQLIKVEKQYIEVDTSPYPEQRPLLYFNPEGELLKEKPSSDETLRPCIYQLKHANGRLLGLQDSVSKKPLTAAAFYSLRPVKHGLLYFERKNYATRNAGYMRYNGEIVLERLNFFGAQISPYDLLSYNNISKQGRWYNEAGKEILPDYYKMLAANALYDLPAINDTARVAALGVSLKGSKFGIYDRSGKALTEEIYDTLTYVTHQLFQFNNKDRKGLVNAKGQELNELKFDEVKALTKFNRKRFAYPWLHFIYRKKGGLMTEEGKVILPAEFQPYTFYLRGNKYLWALKEDGAYVFEITY